MLRWANTLSTLSPHHVHLQTGSRKSRRSDAGGVAHDRHRRVSAAANQPWGRVTPERHPAQPRSLAGPPDAALRYKLTK
jgi:hypothetical protein